MDMDRKACAIFFYKEETRMIFLREKSPLMKKNWEWNEPVFENGIVKDSSGEELEIITTHPSYNTKDYSFLAILNGFCSEKKIVSKNGWRYVDSQGNFHFPTWLTPRKYSQLNFSAKILYCMDEHARLVDVPSDIVKKYIKSL